MKSVGRNSFTPSSEERLSLSLYPRNSCLRCENYVKNSYNDFYKNPSKADTRSQTDGCGLLVKPSVLLRKQRLKFWISILCIALSKATRRNKVSLDKYLLRQTLNSKGPSEDREESDSLSVAEDYGWQRRRSGEGRRLPGWYSGEGISSAVLSDTSQAAPTFITSHSPNFQSGSKPLL